MSEFEPGEIEDGMALLGGLVAVSGRSPRAAMAKEHLADLLAELGETDPQAAIRLGLKIKAKAKQLREVRKQASSS